MLKHYVIPLDRFDERHAETYQRLAPLGIDRQGLIAYCFHFATASDYQTLRLHLIQDMRNAVDNEPIMSGFRGQTLRELDRTIGQCIDWIGGACGTLAELVRLCAGTFNETVRLVQFVGDDVLISIDEPFSIQASHGYPLSVSASAL